MDKEGTTQQLNQCLVGQVSRLLLFRFLYYRQEAYLRTLEVSTPLSFLQTTGTASIQTRVVLFSPHLAGVEHTLPHLSTLSEKLSRSKMEEPWPCTQGVNKLDNARVLQRGRGGLVC